VKGLPHLILTAVCVDPELLNIRVCLADFDALVVAPVLVRLLELSNRVISTTDLFLAKLAFTRYWINAGPEVGPCNAEPFRAINIAEMLHFVFQTAHIQGRTCARCPLDTPNQLKFE
jgi:hypothetical protein